MFFCRVGRVAGDPQIRRHVSIKIEGIKQPLLVSALLSHHAGALPPPVLRIKTLKKEQRAVVFQQNRADSDLADAESSVAR